MKHFTASIIAAAIIFAITGCTNPSGDPGSDSELIVSTMKLTAEDAAGSDYFGYSVSVDGGSYSGSAYILKGIT